MRNPNSNRQPFQLSKNRAQCFMCYSRERSGFGAVAEEMLRFLPQDFHNCGKHCGKRRRSVKCSYLLEFLDFWPPLSPATQSYSALLWCR